MNFNPDNFTFEIEDVSYQMIHGKLSIIRAGLETKIEDAGEFDGDDEIYLLARAYAELLTKVD